MSIATSAFLLPLTYTSSLTLAALLAYLILWERVQPQKTPQEATVTVERV